MPQLFCPKCERFWDSPWGPGWKLKDNPCPVCGEKGKMGITPEQVRRDRERLDRWKKGG